MVLNKNYQSGFEHKIKYELVSFKMATVASHPQPMHDDLEQRYGYNLNLRVGNHAANRDQRNLNHVLQFKSHMTIEEKNFWAAVPESYGVQA